MSLKIRETNAYRRDEKRLRRSGFRFEKLATIVKTLADGKSPDRRHRDHPLTGNWKGYRECHITADWLLIYRIEGNELLLARTGSHSELF